MDGLKEKEIEKERECFAVLEFLIPPTEICPSQAKHGRQETPNTERGIIVGYPCCPCCGRSWREQWVQSEEVKGVGVFGWLVGGFGGLESGVWPRLSLE
jgi:hypothetical protein